MSYLKDEMIRKVIQFIPLSTTCPYCERNIDPGCILSPDINIVGWDEMAREIVDVVVGCVMEYLSVN